MNFENFEIENLYSLSLSLLSVIVRPRISNRQIASAHQKRNQYGHFLKILRWKKKDIMTEKMDVDNISKTSADYYTDR